MNVSNISRFIVEKNAINFLKNNSKIAVNNKINIPANFDLVYSWDEDFKKFSRIDIEKIEIISKNYQNIDLLLKNIYFDKIFSNVSEMALNIIEKLLKNSLKPSLSIINISPLEWAILGKVFNELWINNLVYNFNRSLIINSTSKTLEAILFLYSYESSDYFKENIKKIVEKINKLKLNIISNNYYIIIEENNNSENYSYTYINEYIKSQIWQKVAKNIYRIDKYPDKDYLNSKNIETINIFDNDNSIWAWINYYKDTVDKIKINQLKYELIQGISIGYYEDYLVEKDKEYSNYKFEIEKKITNNYDIYKQNNVKPNNIKDNYIKNSNKNINPVDYKLIPYLVVFPILLISFFIATSKWWNLWWNPTTSSSVGWFSRNGWSLISYPTWTSRSSSSVSTSDSSSSVKSFWWGWFSKWGG